MLLALRLGSTNHHHRLPEQSTNYNTSLTGLATSASLNAKPNLDVVHRAIHCPLVWSTHSPTPLWLRKLRFSLFFCFENNHNCSRKLLLVWTIKRGENWLNSEGRRVGALNGMLARHDDVSFDMDDTGDWVRGRLRALCSCVGTKQNRGRDAHGRCAWFGGTCNHFVWLYAKCVNAHLFSSVGAS